MKSISATNNLNQEIIKLSYMVTLYGRTIKREELLRSVGSMEQVGGV